MKLTIRDVIIWLITSVFLAIGAYYQGKTQAGREYLVQLQEFAEQRRADLDLVKACKAKADEAAATCQQAQRTLDQLSKGSTRP